MAFSIQNFHERYDTDETQVAVNDRSFQLLLPKTIDQFIDSEDLFNDFPLWAKVWEASLVLADYMARRAPDRRERILEIGSGVGFVGVVASAFGHRITSTEYNTDAMAFARANAVINGCNNLEIEVLDWHQPDLAGTFDLIIGSEVIYRERDFKPLLNLFSTCLNPEGEIILTSGMRKTDLFFFKEMEKFFSIGVQKKTLRSDDKTADVLLVKMRAKKVTK